MLRRPRERPSRSTQGSPLSISEHGSPPDILPDILRPGLVVVFCGSAAGRASARRGAYYAGPGNLFWPTLAEVGLTPRRLAPEEFPTLPTYGLGLTDLCKRASGSDGDLPAGADDPDALGGKVLEFRPRFLAFVGKRPASVVLGRAPGYGAQDERIGETRLYVLPSPSGAARRYWDEAWWRELARAARAAQ